jgi:hypothetical protein
MVTTIQYALRVLKLSWSHRLFKRTLGTTNAKRYAEAGLVYCTEASLT